MHHITVFNLTSTGNESNSGSTSSFKEPLKITLIVIYSVVFLLGSTGLSLMINLLKTNIRSITTIAFMNLIVAHFLFLLTVPFRIYYYISGSWRLSSELCKVVSAMVHVHMYIVFTIYTLLLTFRFLQFYKKIQWTEFYRHLHALSVSVLVWFLLLLIILPLILIQYGETVKDNNNNQCFKFEKEFEKQEVYVVNKILSLVIVTVSCFQACIQLIILRTMILKYGPSIRFQQEFWVQIKNFSCVLIMMICMVPYHLFRLKYLQSPESLWEINEVFLAVTGLMCFDMLIFIGRGMCRMCCV